CSERGIGHALAKAFHARGFRVFAASRTLESMTNLTERGIKTFAVDIASSESISLLRDQLDTLIGGQLDILVNNAWVLVQTYPLAITGFDKARVKHLFDANVFGPMEMVHQIVPLIIAARGQVIQVGSMTGIIPVPFNAAYYASIAALHSFGDVLRVELAPVGVDVITV
ncbi:hypothetical protein B0H17DRAFT_856548, partial [Mycena rosella]